MRFLRSSRAPWLDRVALTAVAGALVMACAADATEDTGNANSAMNGAPSAAVDRAAASDAAEKARQAAAAAAKERADTARTMTLVLDAWAEATPGAKTGEVADGGDCIANGRAFRWSPTTGKPRSKELGAFLTARGLNGLGVVETPGAKTGTHDLSFIRGLACYYYDGPGLDRYDADNEMIRCAGIGDADARVLPKSCVAQRPWGDPR
jgi:hypothetical protein